MPHNHEWQSRIKAIEREYVAMRQAADRFRQAAIDDPSILFERLRHSEIVAASRNLEGTYVIRLFAEFETGARQYWESTWNTEPKTVDLLNGLAARCGIPDSQRDNGHLVRDYRNSLVQVSHILAPFRERDGRSFLTGRLLVAWRPEHGFAS
jgi:hypothetical protein